MGLWKLTCHPQMRRGMRFGWPRVLDHCVFSRGGDVLSCQGTGTVDVKNHSRLYFTRIDWHFLIVLTISSQSEIRKFCLQPMREQKIEEI